MTSPYEVLQLAIYRYSYLTSCYSTYVFRVLRQSHCCHLYWLPGSKYLNSTNLCVKVVLAVHVDVVVNKVVILGFSWRNL